MIARPTAGLLAGLVVLGSASAIGLAGGLPAPSVAKVQPAQVAPPPGWPVQPAGVPFPTDEWATGPLLADVDEAAIDDAVEVAFGAPDATGRVQSIVVVEGGRIVYER